MRKTSQAELSGRRAYGRGAHEVTATLVDVFRGFASAHCSTSLCRGSAERERESLDARTKKLDFELAIGDGLRLPDQLVHPLFGRRAVALFVNVDAVRRARRLPVDQHAEFHGHARRRWAHDEMNIAGV